MSAVLRFSRAAFFIVLGLAYALLAHYTNTTPQTARLGILVALAPITLAAFSMAWHATQRRALLALFFLGCASLFVVRDSLLKHVGLIYWIEHAGTELMLGLMFARSLRAQREPMCSYFARMMHGPLSPLLADYTRQVTRAWVGFFAAMAAVSTILFVTTSIQTWSLFANFFTAPLIALMFVVEYAVRKRMLPNIEHAHILDGIKAFWKQPVR